MLSREQAAELARAFTGHGYEVDAVVELLGEAEHRALGRNATVPGRRTLAGRTDPLSTFTRLWLLQDPVPSTALEAALPGLVAPMVRAGLLEADGDEVRALVDVRPYASDDGASGWVVSDLTPGLDTATRPVRPDFVLGVSSASTTLAQLTLRRPVERALDLGTGCGVQSLHLARHAKTVVATDLNPRAVALARLTADLNGVDVDVREGDLYAPVADERFDLIVSNPPYVMSPPTGERLVYREGSLAADGLVEAVVRRGVEHLAEGGVLQVLGNWAHVRGQEWEERVAGWLAPDLDVHAVEREVLDPYAYVELWLADAGLAGAPDYRQRYAEWCDYFDSLRIEGVGLGWITARRPATQTPGDPVRRLEAWPYAVEQPIAPALAAGLDAIDRLRSLSDADVLATAWRLAPDVVEETQGAPGAADPGTVVLRQHRGLRRAVQVDTALGGVLGACDGDLPLDTLVETVAGLLDADAAALRRQVLDSVRTLALDTMII